MKSYLKCLFVFVFLANLQGQEKVYKHPDWSYNKTIYEANIRQFSKEGTFNKFKEALPRLKSMGVGIIWLMPVNPIGEKNRKGTLGSYYSVKDYLDVSPEFGTKEDFKTLVDEIHKKGMYVIIDWVANHTSWDNVLTENHPEWFTKDSADNFLPPKAAWYDVIDLNYENTELRKYMTDALIYWVKEFNIDGYRCDVAEMVPLEFWINARKDLDKIKPVFMLAEGEKPELHEAFDMTYSWSTLNLMKGIVSGSKKPADFHEYLQKEKNLYPEDAFRMRFTTNHDENSLNGTEYELFKEGAETFAALAAVIPGMPLIYSGQEAGLNKRLDFFEKDPIEWKDHKMGKVYSRLFDLKKRNGALFNGEKGGEYIPVETSDSLTLAFIRQKGNEKVFTLFNLSGDEKVIMISNELTFGNFSDLATRENVRLTKNMAVKLAPWQYRILIQSE